MSTTFATSNNGRTDVIVDGEIIGQVFRATYNSSEVVVRSGDARGHGVYRAIKHSNRWAWETPDGMGNEDFTSRKAAVEDMLCFI